MVDEKKYRINIDPRILELLGPSLYTNIYYILAELIANAYDANASNVYIIEKDQKLIVEDDGNGMSYDDGDIQRFLDVAVETRTGSEDSYVKGSDKKRKKMGRKGVGKLAALSVSENVDVLTIKDNDKSGFVLSRNVPENHELTPLSDEQIVFEKISEHGTSVVMHEPHYKLHKTLSAIKNNLLKVFPLVDADFQIHLIRGKQTEIINSYEKEIIKGLGGLIVLGDDFIHLIKAFNSQLKDRKVVEKNLVMRRPPHEKVLRLKNRRGDEGEYLLSISGWIGVYRTSSGKKTDASDFPDNFISLISNKKLGEYNILPSVGKNALNEVYVVGQLHIDLFEDSELPDMALSNRQGYKTDDLRYIEVINYVRNDLLPKAISLRTKFAGYARDQKNHEKDMRRKENEALLRQQVDKFKKNASLSAARELLSSIEGGKEEEIESLISRAINMHLPDMGLKRSVEESKKKVLISHTSKDKIVADFIYQLLVYIGIAPDEIIYTSSDNADSRIPQKQPIFDYLRDFFVDSYSSSKIFVVYITSDNMAKSWAAVSEVGAGWITKSQHDIFNINTHSPQKPLDVDCEWANIRNESEVVLLSTRDADVVAEKLIYICNRLGNAHKSKEEILDEISRTATISE